MILPMKTPRYPFTIDPAGEAALVGMHCDGLIRCRTMPFDMLDALVRACSDIRENVIAVLSHNRQFRDAVPAYPQCVECAHCDGFAGVCDVHVVASRDGTDIEFCSAFYDAGDPSAPALVLVGDQLDQFIAKATTILAAVPDPTRSPR